jgi:hypothetical protein
VIVSPFGLEARRTFITWRVPWAAVESFAVGKPLDRARNEADLTVVLIDGSTRSAHVGARRHGERDLTEAAAAARRHPRPRHRGYLGPNWLIVLFTLSGIALLVACAVADIGRSEHKKLSSVRTTTAKQLRDLEKQIAIGDGFAVALCLLTAATGVAALAWSRRSRGAAPTGPWPRGLRFPDDVSGTPSPSTAQVPSADGERPPGSLPPPQAPQRLRGPLHIPPVVICRDEGVFDADGTLLLAISHRKVTWTETDFYTYWSARGLADFSVQVQPPPRATGAGALLSGARWRLVAWEAPLRADVEVSSYEGSVSLQAVGTADCRLIVEERPRNGYRYVAIDRLRRTLATIEPSWPGWRCEMSADLPLATRRLLCVAALWAEQRSRASSSSD